MGVLMTAVVKVGWRKADREAFLADPGNVYVGRDYLGYRDLGWGNPFHLKTTGPAAAGILAGVGAAPPDDLPPGPIGRDRAIRCYERWLRAQPALLARLPELRGKTLGCWCAPEPCHADVLAKLADGG